MSRASRLLDLIQILRRHRHPVSGQTLASEMAVSLRTVYRDIATLQAQGATIEGEPGVGYILRPGYLLPPLMFSEEEIEALVLGSRWVADRGDTKLAHAARQALAKIAAVLPQDLRDELDGSPLLVGPGQGLPDASVELSAIRDAIRTERKITIVYRDDSGAQSGRTIWPFALAFFDRVRVLIAWCELREGFRHFRTDRIIGLTTSTVRYPRRRPVLLKEWRRTEGIRTGS